MKVKVTQTGIKLLSLVMHMKIDIMNNVIDISYKITTARYSLLTIDHVLLLQRLTAMQVRSSVWLMPQNQPSGRGLLPSPTACSPDQHPAAMLADVSPHILGRTERCVLGFGQLVHTHKGKCLKCQSSSDGHSDHNALRAGGR